MAQPYSSVAAERWKMLNSTVALIERGRGNESEKRVHLGAKGARALFRRFRSMLVHFPGMHLCALMP